MLDIFQQPLDFFELRKEILRRRILRNLQISPQLKPFDNALQRHALIVFPEDFGSGLLDDVARDGVGAAQFSFIFQFELPGQRGQSGIDIGEPGTTMPSRFNTARRSAFETIFSRQVMGMRWLTPLRLSIFFSWRASKAMLSTNS